MNITLVYHLVQINFVPVLLCFIFAAYIINDKSFEFDIKKYFFVSVIVILVLIIIDDMEYIELRRQAPTVLRYVETAMGYIVRPLIPITLKEIFSVYNKIENSKTKNIIFLVPYMINFVAVVGSPWNKLVYSFSEDNQFIRGPLGYITFVVGFFYMGYLVYSSVKTVKTRKEGEASVIIMLAVLCVVSTMLESRFLFVGFLSGGCIIGVVLYYLYLHVTIYSMDALTGAYHRRIFYLDIGKIKHPVTLVSMDLNNLKQINDSVGHNKGDEFISTFSNLIMERKSSGTHLYRLGGDEFVLICKKAKTDIVKQRIEELQKDMNRRGYSFAYGITIYYPHDDIEKILNIADQMMYQKKSKMKEKMENGDNKS